MRFYPNTYPKLLLFGKISEVRVPELKSSISRKNSSPKGHNKQ